MGHTCPYVIVVLGSDRVCSCRVKRGHQWNIIKITLNVTYLYSVPCSRQMSNELVSTVLFAASCVFTYQMSMFLMHNYNRCLLEFVWISRYVILVVIARQKI